MRLASAALCILAAGCVGDGRLTPRISGQIVDEYERPLGPGLVLIEWGPVHAGTYALGALIDEQGRFTADLPYGGTWSLHLFADDYQYLPMQLEVEEHQQIIATNMMVNWGLWMDLTGKRSWPTQPSDNTLIGMPVDETDADNPVLEDVRLEISGDLLNIAADVSDPDGDLSRMILLYDPTTGAGYALNSPSAPVDGDYPNGTYTLQVYLDEAHVPGVSELYMVVSDNMCNDTDIMILTLPE